ncbi:MAG TPA: putative baseplate assembly protein [Thermoanaerobaculia bacterium]
MPLPLPNLDDRRWADLVDEGRSLIPLYAPGWTDHNVHDPGITLLELFAWTAEMELYRLNRVPPAHVRKFLALVGGAPRPPRGARTVLTFGLRAGVTSRALPAGLEVEGKDLAGERTAFRTLAPVTVAGLRLAALQTGRPGCFEDLTARWRRGETVPLLGEDPAPGAALYLGFERPLPAGVPVSLWFQLAGGGSGWEERERLLAEACRAAEVCPPPGPVYPCRCAEEPGKEAEASADAAPEGTAVAEPPLPPHPSARTAWEVQVGPGVWRRLDEAAGEVADDTRSFTLDGRVEVTTPAAPVAARTGAVKANLYYLRCLLVGGAYDAAPELAHLAADAVAAEQAEWVEGPIGTGNSEPHEILELQRAPVHRGKLAVTVTEDGEAVEWTVRPDFDLSGRAGSHFVLDAQAGRLAFGDGESGRRLPGGAAAAAHYHATRAAAGNLPAGRVRRLADNPHNQGLPDFAAIRADVAAVANPLPAAGGTAAETLVEAKARAVEELERPQRAVTLADYEALAKETPGVRLARVAARANLDPALPCLHATGVVTVIVLPSLPRRRPQPSAGTRRAVAAYLARRRLLGTRIVVVGPTYLEVAVRATVRPLAGVDGAALRERVVAALDGFFHPLTGGPDGDGWPFGRDVYRSEVLQLLDEVAGVDHVLGLELVAGSGCGCGGGVCGNVCVGPLGLVAAGRHEITVR